MLPAIDAEAATDVTQPELTDFRLTPVTLSASSPLIGRTLATADVRRNYRTHVVALERNEEFFDRPENITMNPGDRLWIVGTQK